MPFLVAPHLRYPAEEGELWLGTERRWLTAPLRGGGSMVALKFVRRASNRTHIKQAHTVWIATASFVHYAYRSP